VNRSRARGRDVEDSCVRQGVLQAQARTPLLRRRLVAALALAAGGVLHGVALVEDDDSIEVGAQPIDDLPDARNLLLARVGP
jgi:hypothetical protein